MFILCWIYVISFSHHFAKFCGYNFLSMERVSLYLFKCRGFSLGNNYHHLRGVICLKNDFLT
jgi:hypothetical protein